MEIGIGLDGTLGLSYEEQAQLSAEAARLGYTSIWTPEGAGEDSFLLCSIRWAATRAVVAGGLTTGIGVSPGGPRTPRGLAAGGRPPGEAGGGRRLAGGGEGELGGAVAGPARRPAGHQPAAADAGLPRGAGAGDAAPRR